MSAKKDFAKMTMTVTPEIEKLLKETFSLEIEMLQGEKKLLKDGRIKYKLKIYDTQKAELLKEFVLRVIAKDLHTKESNN